MNVWRNGLGRRRIQRLLFAFVVMAALAGRSFEPLPVFAEQNQKQQESESPGSSYIPLDQAMKACGFEKRPEYAASYGKHIAGRFLVVTYHFNEQICRKDSYTFPLDSQWREEDGQYLVYGGLIESITNYDLFDSGTGVIEATERQYEAHQWLTEFTPLIAHAGGAVRGEQGSQTYTNSMAAIIENYNLGHRVFELDFQVTADHGLAAVHDGKTDGDEDGIFMKTSEWQASGGMVIGDVLDQMMINKDMFLVTDTKWKNSTAFEIIREEAVKRDIRLMDRIIPQIYSGSMYEPVMAVYDFPSVIFTTYKTSETPEEIVDFVSTRDNVRVITTPAGDRYISRLLSELARQKGILVYAHTLNDYDDIAFLRDQGVYGLYTDLLIPEDFETYRSSLEN